MHAKWIAGLLLLAVSGAMQPAALVMPLSHAAGVVHRRAELAHHACCPQTPQGRPALHPVQAPRTNDHRCCFLGGSQSSLPTSAAFKEQLVPQRSMSRETPGSAAYLWAGLARNAGEVGVVPSLLMQMSVVLRN
jgi:hypothetical protein